MNTPSSELTTYSTRIALEQLVATYGSHRDSNQGVLRDADKEAADLDGEQLKVRILQLRGIGNQALYHLRVRSTGSHHSVYTYLPSSDTLTQRVRTSGTSTHPLPLPPEAIQPLLVQK